MTTIPITITFIALFVVALNFLTGWIGLFRGRVGVLRNHGDDRDLEKRIRIHGNFTENAPAMALVLAAAEILGASPWALWLAVFAFVVGRVLHFILYDKATRALGMLFTQIPAALLGIWCLYTLYLS